MGSDVYKEVRVFKYDNCIARLHRPDLTEEERNKRMEDFKEATAKFMRGVYKERQEKEKVMEAGKEGA